MGKIPYFHFYPDDYLSSPGVTTCDLEDEGIYLRLLSYSWKHDGCQLPDDILYLKRLCKGVREKRLRKVLSKFFVRIELEKSEFYWRNLRLFTEFCKVHGVSLKRSEAAKVRWDKEKQDAIALKVHMQTDMQNDAIPDTRSQIPDTRSQKRKKGGAKISAFFLPEWIGEEVWAAFEEMRTKIKKPMTDRARGNIVKKLEAFKAKGHDPTAILDNSITGGWQNVYEPEVNRGLQDGGSRGNGKRDFTAERGEHQKRKYDRLRSQLVGVAGDVHGKKFDGDRSKVVDGSIVDVPEVEAGPDE